MSKNTGSSIEHALWHAETARKNEALEKMLDLPKACFEGSDSPYVINMDTIVRRFEKNIKDIIRSYYCRIHIVEEHEDDYKGLRYLPGGVRGRRRYLWYLSKTLDANFAKMDERVKYTSDSG